MLAMDFNKLKDVSWLKHIYQKFDEVGKEVEDLIKELQIISENLQASVLDMDFQLKERAWLDNIHLKVEGLGANVEDLIIEVGTQTLKNGKRIYINIQDLPVQQELVTDETVVTNFLKPMDASTTGEMFYSCDSDPWGTMGNISNESPSMDMYSHCSSAEGEVISNNIAVSNQCLSGSVESSDSLFSSTELMEKKVPLSSLVGGNPSAKSTMESDGIDLTGGSECGYDNSVVSQQGLVSCDSALSVESNEGETLEPQYLVPFNNFSENKEGEVNSAWKNAVSSFSPETDADLSTLIESKMEDIHLTDDESEQSWVLVDDKEVHSVRHQMQGGLTKKRILNFFGRKKMIQG